LLETLDWLREPAFRLWGTPVSWAEVFGDATGIACVWLLAAKKIASWPVGIANNALFFLLFWTARLYADASLQVVFAIAAAYGWWVWAGGGRGRVAPPIRRTRAKEWLWLGILTVAGIGGIAWLLSRHTDSPVPLADATVTSLSLAATYGQARKLVESWWVWIAVDVVSVPLYVSRGLYPTAALYFVFGCLCVAGLRSWTRALGASPGS
jgi:nicotinamide mononucleotide transporter